MFYLYLWDSHASVRTGPEWHDFFTAPTSLFTLKHYKQRIRRERACPFLFITDGNCTLNGEMVDNVARTGRARSLRATFLIKFSF